MLAFVDNNNNNNIYINTKIIVIPILLFTEKTLIKYK